MEINTIFDFKDLIIECSGKNYEIPISSIRMYPNSLLFKIITQKYINSNHYPIRNERHIIKIDRDPNIFNLVMEFYRKHRLYTPYNISYQQICDEFDYFGLPVTKVISMNVNETWKIKNRFIQYLEAILNMLITSEWFSNNMENNISFVWNIGHGYKSDKEYTQIYDMFNRRDVKDMAIQYLKKRHNLNAKWFSQAMIIKENKKIKYFYPNSITGENEDKIIELSLEDIAKNSTLHNDESGELNNIYKPSALYRNNTFSIRNPDQQIQNISKNTQITFSSLRFTFHYE